MFTLLNLSTIQRLGYDNSIFMEQDLLPVMVLKSEYKLFCAFLFVFLCVLEPGSKTSLYYLNFFNESVTVDNIFRPYYKV